MKTERMEKTETDEERKKKKRSQCICIGEKHVEGLHPGEGRRGGTVSMAAAWRP